MQEQEAEAERKKLEELRKEREQERQMQELQRIHEAAGGKRRPERVEWMYATPASSSGPSEAELEDYLLGKKRVDKLLQGNEAQQLTRDAVPMAQEDPDESRASRDMALKIREDPLFAIKKQEQAMREMLMKDPTRLRQMRARLGLSTPRDGRTSSHSTPSRSRDSRDRMGVRDTYDGGRRDRHRHSDRGARHRDYDRREYHRHRDYDRQEYHRHRDYDRRDRDTDRKSRRDEEHRSYHREHSEDDRRRSRIRRDDEKDREHSHRSSRRPSKSPERRRMTEAEREAKLAEMRQNAQQMTRERNAMLDQVQAQEKKTLEQEETERNKARDSKQWQQNGAPGRAAFLLDQQRDLWGKQSGGMDLHERLRRSQHALEAIPHDTMG